MDKQAEEVLTPCPVLPGDQCKYPTILERFEHLRLMNDCPGPHRGPCTIVRTCLGFLAALFLTCGPRFFAHRIWARKSSLMIVG